jgi:general secretion pathway protein G
MIARRSAFTLVEILFVVLILGTLMAFLVPKIGSMLHRIRAGQTNMTLTKIKSAVSAYKMDVGHVPSKQEGGMSALYKKPSGPIAERWHGPYLEETEDDPQDAWHNDLTYNSPPVRFKKYKQYEVFSLGEAQEEDEDSEKNPRIGQ